MLLPDVNVLVSAYRTDSEHHVQAKSWLEHAVGSNEPVGLTDAVATGYVRVVTHPRIFVSPTATEVALSHVEAMRAAGVLRVTPGRSFWSTFETLCRSGAVRGNLVADAAHAATAIEAGATWVTYDRGFARFPGLRWTSP